MANNGITNGDNPLSLYNPISNAATELVEVQNSLNDIANSLSHVVANSIPLATPTVSLSNPGGDPSASVTLTDSDQGKVFNFDFKNLKGEPGEGSSIQLSDEINSSSNASDGVAATPNAVKQIYAIATSINDSLNSNEIRIGKNISYHTEWGVNGNSIILGSNNLINETLNSIAIGRNIYSNSNIAIGENINTPSNLNIRQGVSIGRNINGLGFSFGNNINLSNGGIGIGSNINSNGGIAIGSIINISTSNDSTEAIAIGNFTETVSSSIVIGCRAESNKGDSISIGKLARNELDGSIAIGYWAMTNGKYSLGIGSSPTVTADYSIAIGSGAVVSGKYSIAVGQNANASGNNSMALGTKAVVTDNNTIQLGDKDYLSAIKSKVTSITSSSDERDKTDIEEIDKATDFLKRIKAIRYHWNGRSLYEYKDEFNKETREEIKNPLLTDEERAARKYGIIGYNKEAWQRGDKKGSRYRSGVSAQEVQAALLEVYGTDNYANLVNDNQYDYDPNEIPEGVESELGVNYTNFIPFLIKAIQELDEKIIKENEELRKRIEVLESKI